MINSPGFNEAGCDKGGTHEVLNPPCVDNNLAEAIKSDGRWANPVRHYRLNTRAGEGSAELLSVVAAKLAGERSARSGYVTEAISAREQSAVSRSGAGEHSAAGILLVHGRGGGGVSDRQGHHEQP